MSSLSIRKLPPDLERALIQEARKEGKSKTEIVVDALQRRFGLSAKGYRRERLRGFFGKMTRSEFERFQEATKPFSEIDPELWR